MAEYINDTGAYDQDALFSGTKATDYDYSETNEIVWFSGTGTASTGFSLPDSPFIIFEVYEPDSYTNNLSGGVIVHAIKEFTTDVGTVATTISDWKTAYDTASPFTTYKLKATHYKGSDLADVYDGDESTAFGTATDVDGDFTAHSAVWVMGDDLFSEYVTTGPSYGSELITDGGTTADADEPTQATWDNPMGSFYNPTTRTYGGVDYHTPRPKTADEGNFQVITTVASTTYYVEATLIGADSNDDEAFIENSYVRAINGTTPVGTDTNLGSSSLVTGGTVVNVNFEFTATSTSTSICIVSDTGYWYPNCSFISCREIL